VCAQAYEFFRSSAGCVAHGEKIRQFFRTDPTPAVLERRVPPEKIKIRQIYRGCVWPVSSKEIRQFCRTGPSGALKEIRQKKFAVLYRILSTVC
jgi:hypothetical protein